MDPAAVALIRIAALQRLQRLTRLLDTRWAIPGTRWRFGLDPLLGLIPGLGDVVTLAVSIYMLAQARKIGAPGPLMAAMIGNVALDFLIGEIPVVGDVFDFAFKAHVRNMSLLEKWLSRASSSTAAGAAAPVIAAKV